jgi:hypothetical protein
MTGSVSSTVSDSFQLVPDSIAFEMLAITGARWSWDWSSSWVGLTVVRAVPADEKVRKVKHFSTTAVRERT